MAKKCPPGVICVENATMFSIIFITAIAIYFMNKVNTHNIINHTSYTEVPQSSSKHVKDVKYMPVNIKTQQRETSYSQIGILSRTTNEDVIMPLFGMNVHTGRDKWKYYTVTENNVRLPISVSGKSCTSEYGCDSVGNGDNVYVEGYNDAFKVTLYDDINRLSYIPYI